TTFTIALICGELWQTVVFMFAYIPLRIYAGGYHAKTPLRCYIYSNALIFAVLLIIKFLPLGNFICGSLSLISGAIIFFLSPIEAANKPLDDKEKTVYRLRVRIILAILLMLQIMFSLLRCNKIVMCISLALLMVAALMVVGMIESRNNRL
ncbi:MAG: accessory gene regulator B family protein, partial [Lachnospiraceae bacterium]|nr:accessory gene regulator B family protein [Lachnospiraceae bacterium]